MKRILSIQSHVVFGCAGNSAAVFPMRRMGMEVWPVNTVQFSNHTQYSQGWQGMVMPDGHIRQLITGLADIGVLGQCDALLSGYLGSAEQGEEILAAVARLKALNPNALYFCDPVMGHPDKGCIVAPGVADFLKNRALACADMLAPNLLELEQLTEREIRNVPQALAACQQLRDLGVKLVMVKYLGKAGFAMDRFEMLLVCEEGAFHISRPLYPFARDPIGVGDLLSATMLANLLAGFTPVAAFERTNASVDAVMAQTWLAGAYELQLVAAQQVMVLPQVREQATRL
ncbi:TPA: pyridoxal kinase PdxY [Aeromonas salmonicida]|uniref:Pyridoxal kinase PdxY n=2 Tax=Aeromonas salmonicida subsp. salmonicida TaxID=29491 RepID=A4SQG2_AERS4|nr:pyridoxal kinase PdxY [Aeromonas salmonicida]ABO91134.1 pyridoxamine kinase [Aeromonas salmonicida subsp. salmonicida A449]ASI22678.1 pyridoxal kinase [Aeromonas salmonicida]ASI26994.1 pyridoxal kinase [Aeromonas salmonicida]ASI31112.1 pyridoxal kinase [Aeromonas salmonicida]ATD39837.1 pyridoxal kinase [Aeromonas salmonicida subsp. masoucida]